MMDYVLQSYTTGKLCKIGYVIQPYCLSTGKLPKEWKQANISPIHKKGSKTLPQNYRPVSITSVVGKIMEEIIRDTITVHMKENELLSKCQFGFVKGRSTVLQLLKVLDIWTETLDNGG